MRRLLSDIEIEFDYGGLRLWQDRTKESPSIPSHLFSCLLLLALRCAQRLGPDRNNMGQMDHRGARVEIYFPSQMSEVHAFQPFRIFFFLP